ncbi:proton-coupled folate transporter-like [Venturia canescens]|uniref:proton-coupled folate transporter-like n=1 Tax=Venturia canescens TaxID=32260 RepID=UPI001C9BFFB0|nr:proton-coupled folate transporter-like [Venturia canescens]
MEFNENAAFKGWRSYVLVEPPVMLYFFGQAIIGAVTSDLMIFRTCQAILGTDKGDCDILHSNSSSSEAMNLQTTIQPYVSYIVMNKSFIDGLVPAILSFCLGSWSDKYGRKPILLASYSGSAISFFLWAVLSSMELNPWWYLLASVPPALVGGYSSLILATYCYITDITSERERAWHMTWQQSVIPAGQFLGSFAGPAIYKKFGYVGVFATASAGGAISALYVLIFVPETVAVVSEKKSLCSLFDLTLIKDMIKTCVKKRRNTDRLIMWCCILSLAILMLVGEGELSIAYLFASAKLGWGIDKYYFYQAIVVLLTVIGALVGAKVFKSFVDKSMADMLIATIAVTSSFAGAITKSFTTKSWHFYLSTGLAMFNGLCGPVLRAALSKSVPSTDTGKVFSFETSMEAMIALASGPLYAMIYGHFMPPIYPSPVFLLSGGFYAFIIILVVIIEWRIKKNAHKKAREAIDPGIVENLD